MNAPRFEIVGSGEAFAVMHDGRTVSRTYSVVERAWAAADRLERAARSRIRRCLCCEQAFISEGIHNRLCHPCRQLGWPR